MKRPVKAPLLVTRCDLCCRRRTCAPIVGRRWLCLRCIWRVVAGCSKACLEFQRQGR
jgi:hypothetical protein